MNNRSSVPALLGWLLWAVPAQAQFTFQHQTVDGNSPDEMEVKGVGDLDGDGFEDLVVASNTGAIVWYEDRSTPGLWTKHVLTAASAGLGGWSTDLETADLDRDGDLDLVISDWYDHDQIVWFENLGSAASWSMHAIGSPAAHDIELADFDGDGDLDIVTRKQSFDGNLLRFWRQDTPTSWFQSTLTLPSVTIGEGLDVGDIDDDGDPDVAIAGYWYECTGDFMRGAWAEHQYATTSWDTESVVMLVDMDTDGDLDVVLTPAESAGGVGTTAWFQSPATPTLSGWTLHVVDSGIESVTHSLQVADFDLDGDLDIATAEMHQGANPDEVRLYSNLDGAGTTWSKTVLDTIGSHDMQVLDAGGDGDFDLFGANWTLSTHVDLWHNDIAGSAVYCVGSHACPCANVTRRGGGCRNSEGQGARLTWRGSTSVSADDLELRTTDMPQAVLGLAVMGSARPGVPFGDGKLCVAGPIYRFGVSNSGSPGLHVVGPGVVGLTHSSFAQGGQVSAGQTWCFQSWFRDPQGPCGSAFNLSNGLALTFGP